MTRLLATALLLVPLGGAALAQGQEAKVEANDKLEFAPKTITVPVGGKVTWTNSGVAYHTVTGGENGAPDPSSPIGNGTLASQGATYSVTFKTAGTYPYFCQPHVATGMVGEIVVGGAAATGSPAVTRSPAAAATVSASPVATEPAEPAEPAESAEGLPGLAGNHQLEEIEARRAAEETTLGGFRAFTWVATAALFVLGAALIASTRARRGR